MNKLVTIGLGAVVVVVALLVSNQLLGPSTPGGVGGSPSPTPTPVGGSVEYRFEGAPATTEVDAVSDGATVSGTAVSTFRQGTHEIRVECAADYGGVWAFGGRVEETTVPGERAGLWSAVIVKEGSPQQVGLWLSDEAWDGTDCDAWLASLDLTTIDPSNFDPVESGSLVPPPGLAS